jgi:uncharacterized metal-binding protein/predicted Fe-Mo cluster-binding NifX family protein
MRYGIPLLKNRVSPRCTIADSVLVVIFDHGRIESHRAIPLEEGAWTDLIGLLLENQVDTLVSGGISRETRQILTSYGFDIIDNVACSVDELLVAVGNGQLRPGYGLSESPTGVPELIISTNGTARQIGQGKAAAARPWEVNEDNKLVRFDCLNCSDRVCLRGQPCYPGAAEGYVKSEKNSHTVLEVARDISCEEDRKLCRVAELVYFCLGMKYRRVGLAFCLDLIEPAGILAGLLRRFFEVYPVSCKVGGIRISDPLTETQESGVELGISDIACNPVGQARVLNQLGTDINIIVGLCMGVDCLFTQVSRAPVTTLFVKDKSLVNNPIGAIYSDYYLNEVIQAPMTDSK